MIDSLLIPLDGSDFGEFVLPFAKAIAKGTRASVHLTHVHQPHTPDELLALTQYQFEGVNMAEYDWEDRTEEKAYLERIASELGAGLESDVSTEVLTGEITGAIEGYAKETGTDLLVMATHGRTGLSRSWLGSQADNLVRHTTLPILLVRPCDDDAESPPEARFHHLLIPLDGSHRGEAILDPAVQMAKIFGARMTLLQVVASHVAVGARVFPVLTGHLNDKVEMGEKYLEGIADGLKKEGIPVQTRVVKHAVPARAILRTAKEVESDLIAMATHGYGGLVRAVMGSVADKILRGSSCPILLERPELEG